MKTIPSTQRKFIKARKSYALVNYNEKMHRIAS